MASAASTELSPAATIEDNWNRILLNVDFYTIDITPETTDDDDIRNIKVFIKALQDNYDEGDLYGKGDTELQELILKSGKVLSKDQKDLFKMMKKNISNDDFITITAGWNKDNIFIPIKGEAREAIKKALPKKLSKDSAFYKQVKLAVSQSPQVQRAVAESTPQKTVDSPEAKAKRDVEEKKLDTIKILSSVLIPTDKKLEFITLTTSNGIVYEDAKEIRPGFATLTSPNLKKLLDDLKAVKPVSYAAELTKQLQTLPDDKLTVVMAKFGEVGGAHNETVDSLKDSRKISYSNQEAEIEKIKKDPEYKILFEPKSGLSDDEEKQLLLTFMNLVQKADSDAESLLRIAKKEADQQLLEIVNDYQDKLKRAVEESKTAREAKPFSQERFNKAKAALKQVIEEKKTLQYNADTLFTNLSKDKAMEKVKGHTDKLSRVLQRSQENAKKIEQISNTYRDELLLKLKERTLDDDKIAYLLANKNAIWDGGHIPKELADEVKDAIDDNDEDRFLEENDTTDPPTFTLKIGLTRYNKYIDQLKQKIQDRTVIVEQLESKTEEDVKKKLLELYGKSEELSTNAVSKGDPAAQYLVAKFSSNIDQFHLKKEFFYSFVRISIASLTSQLKNLNPSYDKIPLLRNKGVDIQKQVDKLQKQLDEFTKIKDKKENELRDYFVKEYYIKASAQEYADAQYELASIYLLNPETNSGIKNYDNAISLLDDAIAQGQPDAAKVKKQWQDSGVTDQASWEQYWESKRPSTTYEKVVLHRDPTKLFGSPPPSISVQPTTAPAAIAAVVSASSATAAAGATGAAGATTPTSAGTSSPSGSVVAAGAAGASTPNPTVSPGPDIFVKIGSETFVLSAEAPTALLGATTVLLLKDYEARFGTDAAIKNTVAKYWKISGILDTSISNPNLSGTEFRVPCGTKEIAFLKTGFTSYSTFLDSKLSEIGSVNTDQKSAMNEQRDFVNRYLTKLDEPINQKTCIKVQDTPIAVAVGSADGTVATTTSVNAGAIYYEVLPKLFALMYKNAKDLGPLDITQLFAKYGTTKEEIKALLESLKAGEKPDTFKDVGQDGVHGMAAAVVELYHLLPVLFPDIYGHLATPSVAAGAAGVAGAGAAGVAGAGAAGAASVAGPAVTGAAGAPVAGAGTPPSGPTTYDLIAKLQEIIDKFGFDDTTKVSIITAFQEANTAYLTGKPEEAGPKIAAALTSIHTHVDTKMKAVLKIIEEISTMYLALQAARKTAIETLAKTPIPFPPTFVASKATLDLLRKTLIEYINKLPEPIKPLYSKMFANEEAFDGAIDALETRIKALPASGSAPGGITLKPGETAVKTADLATLAQKVAEATAIMNEEPDEDKLNAELQRRLTEAIANLEAAELSTSTKRAALLERVGQAINIMNGEPDEDALNKAMADHLKAALEKIDQLENNPSLASASAVEAILKEKADIQKRLDNALRLLSEAEKRRIIAPEKSDENNDNTPEGNDVSAGIADLAAQGAAGASGSDDIPRLRAEVNELKAKNTQLQIDLDACLAKQKQAGSSEEDKRTIQSLTEQVARLSARQITETPGADQFLSFKQKIYKDVSSKLNSILDYLGQSAVLPDDFKDKLKEYQDSMKGDNYKVSNNMDDQKDVEQFELAIGELIRLLPKLCNGKRNVNDLVETPYSSDDELLLGVFMEVKGHNNQDNKQVAELMAAKLKENNPGSTDEITEEDVEHIREKYKTKKESEEKQERNKLLLGLFRKVEGYKKKADGSPEKSDEEIAARMTTELQSDPTHSTETISVDDATLAQYLYDYLQRGTDQFGSLSPMPKIASDKERRLLDDIHLYKQVTTELSSLVRAFNQGKVASSPEKQELALKLASVSPEDKKLERAFNRLGSKINGKNDKEIAGLMKEELKEDISVDQVEKARKLALETKTLIARLMTEKTKEPNKKTYTEDDVSRLRSIGETERIRLDTKFGRQRSASESSTESVSRPEIPAALGPQSRLKPSGKSALQVSLESEGVNFSNSAQQARSSELTRQDAVKRAARAADQLTYLKSSATNVFRKAASHSTSQAKPAEAPAPKPAEAPAPSPSPAPSPAPAPAQAPAPVAAPAPLPPSGSEVKEITPVSETTDNKKDESRVLQELKGISSRGELHIGQKTTINKLKQLPFFKDFLDKASISDEDIITIGDKPNNKVDTISQFAKDKMFTYDKLSVLQKERVNAYLYFIWAFLHKGATIPEKQTALMLIENVKTKLDAETLPKAHGFSYRGGAYTPTPLRGPEELPDILEEQDAWNKANDAYNNLEPEYKTLLPPPEPAPISSLATPFQNYINNEADPEALEEARDALGMVPPEDIEDYINNAEYENETNGNSVSERVAPMYQTALPRVKPEWVSIMIRADILQQLLQNKMASVQ